MQNNNNIAKDELVQQNQDLKDLLMKLNQDKMMFEKKVASIQEQQKSDLLYYSKKIKQNDEMLLDIKTKYEGQLKDAHEQNQILKSKLEFLIGKTNFYHEALNDMNKQVGELHQLRMLQIENQKKADEDIQTKNTQKIAQLEVRNSFLIEQVKNMESDLNGLEKLVTNIEQQTMQTKKRGK